MTTIQKCDVCRVHPKIGVACSPLGAISVGYCHRCLIQGYEPMGTMVGCLMGLTDFEGVAPEVADLVRKSLKFHQVSEVDFWKQVAATEADCEQYLEQHTLP